MQHVRQLSQWQFYPDVAVNVPVNFSFTRAFLGDQFKGSRTRSEVTKNNPSFTNTTSSNRFPEFTEDQKRKQKEKCNPTENVSAPVCKHIIFSDSEDSKYELKPINAPKAALQEVRQNGIIPSTSGKSAQSRKYLTSVAYTLKSLLNSDTTTSESESSSTDSTHGYKTQNPHFPKFTSLLETRNPDRIDSPFDTYTNNNVAVSSDVDDLDEMLDEMQRLGFPTSFGCPHKQKEVDLNHMKEISSDYDDEEMDQWLLLFASKIGNNLTLRKKEDTTYYSFSDTDMERVVRYSKSFLSSSEKLRGLVDPYVCAASVFSRMCYIFEMVCVFTSSDNNATNSYRTLGEWKLSLPRCWDSPTFNLEALLYNCRSFWRFKPPAPKKTANCNQMIYTDFDPLVEKYWAQRFRLFSCFDSGIQVDRDSLFSATPEVIAAHQAKRMFRTFEPFTRLKGTCTVLDIFCGTGSNAIQLALRGFRVVAIESDPVRISMASHNAEIYGVRHLIEFVCEDYFTWAWKKIHLRSSQRDCLYSVEYMAAFMSPPWGGPSYLENESYDVSSIKFKNSNADLWCALYLALVLTNGNVALFLPRNTNMANFIEISIKCIKTIKTDLLHIEFELDLINFKSKALTVYFGVLATGTKRTVDTIKSDHSDESNRSD